MRSVVVFILSVFFLQGCLPLFATSAATTTVSVARDRRTTGTMFDDKLFQIKAFGKVQSYDFNYDSHIVVTSYNGNVLLTGQTPKIEYAEQVEKDMRAYAGVKHVYNQLEIEKPTSLSQRTKDAYLNTTVKTQLLLDKEVDPNRMKVVTENNVVYLMGLVTYDEGEIAVEIARRVSGVQRVVKMFEYVPLKQ